MSYDPIKRGAACSLCPRKGQRVVPPEGRPGAYAAWVGQDPGTTEEKQGRPFVGPTGTRLAHLWEFACQDLVTTWDRKEVWVTNAVLCRPVSGGEKEMRDAVTCCRPRLLKELRLLNPRAGLLLMGKWAYCAVTGEAKGHGGKQGFHIPVSLKEMAKVNEVELAKLTVKKAKKK